MSLRVLLTATSYPSDEMDWKGLFIRRIVEALARRVDLGLTAWLPPGPLPENVGRATVADDDRWLRSLMDAGGIAHLLRRRPLRGIVAAASLLRRQRRSLARSDAGLFHVNWLQNALALPRDGRPAVITVLGTDMQLLRLPGMRVLLRRALHGRRTAICPNAEWMVAPLEQAFGDVSRVQYVPFGVDGCWYQIRRHADDGTNRWLCVSRLTVAKLGPLFEWGETCFTGAQRELHLFGPRQEAGISIPDWVHYHGPATPDQLCKEWFPRASGLVTLSRHAEGRPQVMLEAMAAGMPILASRLPAHADLVKQDRNGRLCDDAAEFSAGLDALEDPIRNADMGRNAREAAHALAGDWDDCAARYVDVYRQLLAERQ